MTDEIENYQRLKTEIMDISMDPSQGDIYTDSNKRERTRRLGRIRVETETRADQVTARQVFKKICALAVHESYYKNCISDLHFQRLTAGLYLSSEKRGSFHYTYGTLYATGDFMFYSEFPSFLKDDKYEEFVAQVRGFSIPNKTLCPSIVSYKFWSESVPLPASLVPKLSRHRIQSLEKVSDSVCVKTCAKVGLCSHEHQEFELSRVLEVLDLKITSTSMGRKGVDSQMSKWIEGPGKMRGHVHGGGSQEASSDQKKRNKAAKPKSRKSDSGPSAPTFKW